MSARNAKNPPDSPSTAKRGASPAKESPQTSAPPPAQPPPPPRRVNPFVRLIVNRLTWLALLLVIIFGGCGACALFAPTFFQQTIQAAQSAGLKVYTVILGVTGNSALQIVTYQAQVVATTTVTRDMGALSFLYGENAQVTGTLIVALGADLKNNQFGVLSCDIDVSTLKTNEQRAPLAGNAFDPQQIKRDAYTAFETQAAQEALAKYWPQARQILQQQAVSWALGVKVPDQPTLTVCPSLTETSTGATVTPTP